jgi:hypothetical protein
MKHPKEASHPIPRYDYGLALQSAVSWLGDRYLLAEPVTRRIEERKPFFVEPRSWHDPRQRNVLRRPLEAAARLSSAMRTRSRPSRLA